MIPVAKSKNVNQADIQAMFRLVGECRELGDDPLIWRAHFIAEAARLVDADVAAATEMFGCLAGNAQAHGVVPWGFDHGFDPAGFQIIWEWNASDPTYPKYWPRIHEELLKHPYVGFTAARHELLSDRAWDQSPDYQIAMRIFGAGENITSYCKLARGDDVFDGISWFRAAGRRTFSEHEVALIELMHREVARLVDGPLAGFDEPRPTQLPPRVRQVLRYLLEGDADKQIAVRLNLSRHTVHQYAKQIYQHFKVSGRAELLARWLRRGWTSAAVWDSPTAVAPLVSVP